MEWMMKVTLLFLIELPSNEPLARRPLQILTTNMCEYRLEKLPCSQNWDHCLILLEAGGPICPTGVENGGKEKLPSPA
jgi:hypothetical protein